MIFLDVRTKEEYDDGHVENAINIDIYDPAFMEKIGALDKNEDYSVYCQSGARSGQAIAIMSKLGFTSLKNLNR